MSSPMNTLLLGLTMYDTLLIVTSVMMVGVPSIHTHSSYVIDTQPHDRSESRASNGGQTKVRESQRRPLQGPSPGRKHLLALSHLRHNVKQLCPIAARPS